MTGHDESRPGVTVLGDEITKMRAVRPKFAIIAALLLPAVCVLISQCVNLSYLGSISAAYAAGNGNGNGKSNGNANANGNGNGNAGGAANGNGNGAGNGNGNGNGLANGITNGNGLGIDLGDGIGMGIGVGDGDTIGVGVGISLGDGPGDRRALEKESGHKDPPRSHGREGNGWSTGNAGSKRKPNGANDIDLGEKFDMDRVDDTFGTNIDELSKLLNPVNASGQDAETGNGKAEGSDRAAAGNADLARAGTTRKNEPGADAAKLNGNGNAFGKTKENGNGNGKALAKGKTKNQEINEAADVASVSPSREESASNTAIPTITVGSYVEHEVLALGLSPAGNTRARQLGFSVSETGLEQDDKALITLYAPARLDALQAISLLRREIPRETFQLNRIYRPYNTATKDDLERSGEDGRCRGDKCYGRIAIGWNEELAHCANDINVGVIDTDVDIRHPTFAGQKITRRTFLADGKQTSPNWHGTGVLALLAGRQDSNTPGLIPEAKFFVANVFFADGNGESITDTVSLLKSLEWMKTSQARVINMSFSGPEDELIQLRLRAMRRDGFVFTAAAGNEGPAALPTYPAAYPEVIAVTAVTKDKKIYPSANRGTYIDLAAPGVGIWTAMPEIKEGYRTGTSFAAPFVTAVVALQRQDLMYAAKDELLDHMNIMKLGPREQDQIYGRGLLQAPGQCSNANASVSNLAPPASAISR